MPVHPVTGDQEADVGGFMDKARDLADQHDEQVDQGLEKAGDVADQKTGGGHAEQIDRGVDMAQERTGEGDTQP
jgi:MT0933-like antitoxin protein